MRLLPRLLGFACCLVGLAGTAPQANASEWITLKATGSGLFSPANIGKTGQEGAGVVLGDGSGSSAYQAFGWDFELDGIQFGPNLHLGANKSYSTGIPQANGTLRWPVESAKNPYVSGKPKKHVMVTLLGEIHFKYDTAGSYYEFDPVNGIVRGHGDFEVVGGTGLFKKAKGNVAVLVTSYLAEDVTEDGVFFDYDFQGSIKLK
jgi:hypothetical protein